MPKKSMHNTVSSDSAKRTSLPLLSVFCLLPSFQTAVSVYWEWHTPVTYPALKGAMLLIPIILWSRLRRSGVDVQGRAGWKKTNMLAGLCVGILMGGIMLVAYHSALRPVIDPAPLLQKIRSLGLVEYYWIMAVFVCLWNSLFEEYYWRAFITGELRAWSESTLFASIVGGGLFGIHHLFLLLPLFEWPLLSLCVLGTMIAGAVWSWMRLRGASILDCYISHILADLSVMWIGYDLVRRAI